MKFQNPSLIFFLNRQTDTHRHGRTDRQAETNMLPLFFKVGGIKSVSNNEFTALG